MTTDDTDLATSAARGELAQVHYLPAALADTNPVTSEGEVLDAELITEEEYQRLTSQKAQAFARYAGYRRDAVTVYRVVRTVATHGRTRRAFKAVARHLGYVLGGALVLVTRLWQSKTSGRYERIMRAAEATGNFDLLAEWESRSEQFKQRRHGRVMAWLDAPLKLMTALGLGLAGLTGLLLALGIVLAVANEDAEWILAPIGGLLDAVRWGVWFIGAYGALMLLTVTAAVIAVFWQVGRAAGVAPQWTMPAASTRATGGDPITPSIVVKALRDLGIAPLRNAIKDMGDAGAGMLGPITLAGCGVEVDITLPSGAFTTQDIQRKRRTLAENLGRHEHELFVTIPQAARTVRLWIADSGALDEPIEASPLVVDPPQRVSMHRDRAPLGQNLRADAIALNLWQKHVLMTGLSNMGKTAALRALALWLAFDLTVEFRLADLKGLGDWRMFRDIARILIEGPTDEHVIAATEMIEAGVAEMERRLTSFDADKYPDGVPPGLPGYHPIVLIVDEAQVAFMCPAAGEDKAPYGGKSNRSRFFMACRKMLNQGRAVNMLLWLGTQDPTDQNLPKLVREAFHIRASLKVGSPQQSVMALGENAVNDGAAPHELKQEHKGTVVITGMGVPCQQGQTSEIVRTHFVDGTAATEVADHAKTRRAAVATRTEGEQTPRDLLADVAEVLAGEAAVKATDVCARLRRLAPNHPAYAGLTAEGLAEQLADEGVAVRKKDGVLTVRAQLVQAALADRDE